MSTHFDIYDVIFSISDFVLFSKPQVKWYKIGIKKQVITKFTTDK